VTDRPLSLVLVPLTRFLTVVTATLAHTGLSSGSTPQAGGAGASIAAAEAKRLRDALSRVGVMGSEVRKASFTTKHLEQDLGRLLQVSWRAYPLIQATGLVRDGEF